jgi:hypothetical protein
LLSILIWTSEKIDRLDSFKVVELYQSTQISSPSSYTHNKPNELELYTLQKRMQIFEHTKLHLTTSHKSKLCTNLPHESPTWNKDVSK